MQLAVSPFEQYKLVLMNEYWYELMVQLVWLIQFGYVLIIFAVLRYMPAFI